MKYKPRFDLPLQNFRKTNINKFIIGAKYVVYKNRSMPMPEQVDISTDIEYKNLFTISSYARNKNKYCNFIIREFI